MSERVSVAQAAKELGMTQQGVREQMKRGNLDIGTVAPSVQNPDGRNQYYIYREKLDAELGKNNKNQKEELVALIQQFLQAGVQEAVISALQGKGENRENENKRAEQQ